MKQHFLLREFKTASLGKLENGVYFYRKNLFSTQFQTCSKSWSCMGNIITCINVSMNFDSSNQVRLENAFTGVLMTANLVLLISLLKLCSLKIRSNGNPFFWFCRSLKGIISQLQFRNNQSLWFFFGQESVLFAINRANSIFYQQVSCQLL